MNSDLLENSYNGCFKSAGSVILSRKLLIIPFIAIISIHANYPQMFLNFKKKHDYEIDHRSRTIFMQIEGVIF